MVALAVTFGLIAKGTGNFLILGLLILWLFLLKIFKRLSSLVFGFSLLSMIFFYLYMPVSPTYIMGDAADEVIHLNGRISSTINYLEDSLSFTIRTHERS